MAHRRLSDVVLYHGSLAELNSRSPKKQYKFAEELLFLSHEFEHLHFHFTAQDLFEMGYDGLVNMRTISNTYRISDSIVYKVEGTPIVRA